MKSYAGLSLVAILPRLNGSSNKLLFFPLDFCVLFKTGSPTPELHVIVLH